MIKKRFTYRVFVVAISSILLNSCVKHEDSPGYEYTPDMYRSPAIEAYVDYGMVKDKMNDSVQMIQSAKLPPVGTIPFKGNLSAAEINMPYHRLPPIGSDKSHGIFSLAYSATDYDASVADKSPMPYSAKAGQEGSELYTKFCLHCHGVAGAGDGKVSMNDNINPPANAFSKPEGQMFYSITYGKGVMGAHASQLTKEERWKVIMHLKKLNNGGTYPFASEGIDPTMVDMFSDHSNDSVQGNRPNSIVLNDLFFTTGSSNLDLRRSRNTINSLVTALSMNENAKIELAGHTDNTGDASMNLSLSEKRAMSVKEQLMSYGIEGSRIIAKGYGDTQPIASNDTEEGKAKNRRTEVKILD